MPVSRGSPDGVAYKVLFNKIDMGLMAMVWMGWRDVFYILNIEDTLWYGGAAPYFHYSILLLIKIFIVRGGCGKRSGCGHAPITDS